MNFQKNEILTVSIDDMGIGGEGIGKKDGYPFFVKDTIAGDVAEIQVTKAGRSYGYARLKRLVEASPYRCTPACPVSRSCGGCQLQEMTYARQLVFKEQKVRGNLMRIGGIPAEILDAGMEPILSMEHPVHFRNKVQYPVGYDKDGRLCAGFYAGRTHMIVATDSCIVHPVGTDQILQKILTYMETHHISAYDSGREGKHGLVRHILIRYAEASGEWMVCLVINSSSVRALPGSDRLVASLTEIPGMTSISVSFNTDDTNVIMGRTGKLLWGRPAITDAIGGLKFEISPLSFYQVNSVQMKKLYDKALEYAALTGRETVWDLYCGIGTISLFLAKKAVSVCGVEIVPQAVEDAKANAERNHITNVEFLTGAAEKVLTERYRRTGEKADVIIVDPPRKGCDESVLETMVRMEPERIVYVSCDSATLARDLKYLCGAGYRLAKVCPCDMFPYSVHVETVVQLSRKKPDDVIEIDLNLDELDATSAETKATYEEIKEYVLKETGLKVSSLYISQVKRKCGLEVGESYNLPKSEKVTVPQCPKDKEDAIRAALKHFAMI